MKLKELIDNETLKLIFPPQNSGLSVAEQMTELLSNSNTPSILRYISISLFVQETIVPKYPELYKRIQEQREEAEIDIRKIERENPEVVIMNQALKIYDFNYS